MSCMLFSYVIFSFFFFFNDPATTEIYTLSLHDALPISHTISLTIRTNGQLAGPPVSTNFTVPAAPLPARYGYVSIATNKMYFQTGDGQAMPLRGENVAFGTPLGTYAYDMYLPAMAAAGENFARVIMTPMGFGIEVSAASLTKYSLGPAWQMDYVLQLAEQLGIYMHLCLEVG